MRHSIKQDIMIRIALIFLVVIVSGIVTISGMGKVRKYSNSTEEWTAIHSLVLTAQKAHYEWVENLCSATAMGTEFTKSTDYKGCVLGKWFYDPEASKIPNDIEGLSRLVEGFLCAAYFLIVAFRPVSTIDSHWRAEMVPDSL